MLTTIEIDCATGLETVRPMTADEAAAHTQAQQDAQAATAAQEAAATAAAATAAADVQAVLALAAGNPDAQIALARVLSRALGQPITPSGA